MDATLDYTKEIVDGYNPEDVLYLFDIDQTLIEPTNPAAQFANIIKHKKIFFDLKLRYSCFAPVMIGCEAMLHDHDILDDGVFNLLTFLNEKNIRNLGFTATPNILVNGQDLREVRFQQLKKNNISFEQHFPQQEIIFDSVNLLRKDPCLYKGIIFSNGDGVWANKGIVLQEFLKTLDKKPQCIIFCDDNLDNHLDVNQHLAIKNPDIDCYSIHFTKAMNMQRDEITEEEFEKIWDEYFRRESYLCTKCERKKFNFQS